MSSKKPTYQELKANLAEAEDFIAALRKEEVDAVVGNHHVALLRLKEAEEALRESEQRYRQLFEGIGDSVMVYSLQGIFLDCNEATLNRLGYTHEELLRLSAADIVHPDFHQFMKDDQKRIWGGEATVVESAHLCKDGKVISVEVNARRIEYKGESAILAVVRDITERKQAEEALRESEEKYRQLFTIESDAIMIFDAETKQFIDANDSVLRLYGYTREEFLKLRQADITAEPEESEDSIKEFLAGKLAGIPVRYHKKKDGTMFPVEISGGTFKLENRQVLFGVIRDITERKRAEEALRESEEKYRSLVESTEDSIYLIDRNCRYLFINRGHLSRFPLPTDKVIGRTYGEFHSEEETKDFVEKVNEVFKTGKPLSYEYRSQKDGGYFLRTLSPVQEPDGKTTSVTVVSKDITEHKQAEEALRESETQKRAILDASIDRIRLIDRKMRIIWANETHARELNMATEELVGNTCYEIFHGKDAPCDECPAQKTLKTGKIEHAVLARSQAGKIDEKTYLDSYSVPIKNEYGEIVNIMNITRDITDSKKAEEELQRSQEELRNLADHLQSVREQERTNVAREIHDELGQALAALKMDISWLGKKLPKDQESLFEKTKSMSELTDMTIKTVKRLSTELRPGILDDLGLSAAIEWQADEFENRTGIRCRVTVDPGDMIVDRDRSTAIFRILQETLTNISRHAQATRVTVSLKEKDATVELKVRDNGKGITEEQISQPKSFGLVGIRERAHSCGGEVKIKGAPGKGTTVTVSIPINRG